MAFNKILIYLSLLIMVIALSCVRYSFRGALPSYLKTIYIEDFDNQTQYAGVREDFMQKITEGFIKDNSLRVIDTEEGADLVLSGAITSINRQPVSITQQEQVQQFKMVVNIRAECMNTHTQKALWNGNVSRFGIIPGNATATEIDQAITEATDQIVEDMINNTIAAW